MTDAPANNPAPTPPDELTVDELKVLFRDTLLQARDLAGRIHDAGGEELRSNLADFSGHEPDFSNIPELNTAEGSEKVSAARTAIRAANLGVDFLSGIEATIQELAAITGLAL